MKTSKSYTVLRLKGIHHGRIGQCRVKNSNSILSDDTTVNKPEPAINTGSYDYQPVSRLYLPRTYKRLNLIARHESMPEIMRTKKQIITSKRLLRSVSLNEMSRGKYTNTSVTCIPNIRSIKRLDIASIFLNHCNKNVLNRCAMSLNLESCGFSSEWIFEKWYDCYMKQNYASLPMSEGRVKSENSLLARSTTENLERKDLSRGEISEPNQTVTINMLKTKNTCCDKSDTDSCCQESNTRKLKISERIRLAKDEGILLLLEGKTYEQKKKILKGFSKLGILLPEGKTCSDEKMIDEVRNELGLPPKPDTSQMRDLYEKAADAGLLQPLEGKSHEDKEQILLGLIDMGVPLPEGRTCSEKALLMKVVKQETNRHAKLLALPDQISNENTMEVGNSEFECICDLITLESDIESLNETLCICDLVAPEYGRASFSEPIIVPKASRESIDTLYQSLSLSKTKLTEKIRQAKYEGVLLLLAGEPPKRKEEILKSLVMIGIQLPEGKTNSDKNLIDRVCTDLGLPLVPVTADLRKKYELAAKRGLLQPLEGKISTEKENIIKGLAEFGVPLPKGRSASEKALIDKVIREINNCSGLSKQDKVQLKKSPQYLTVSKKSVVKCNCELLIPDSKKRAKVKYGCSLLSSNSKEHNRAKASCCSLKSSTIKTSTIKCKKEQSKKEPVTECECQIPKSHLSKASMFKMNTAKANVRIRKAKAAGLLTPLSGKTLEQKRKILEGLAANSIMFPEPRSDGDKILMEQVRINLGLPPGPNTSEMKEKYKIAVEKGLLQPLEGKNTKEKEKIIKGLLNLGIPLPKGRCTSEQALLDKIQARTVLHPRSKSKSRKYLESKECKNSKQQNWPVAKCECNPATSKSEKMTCDDAVVKIRTIKNSKGIGKTEIEGLLIPLDGKTSEQKGKIFRALSIQGIILSEDNTDSDRQLINEIHTDLGVPCSFLTETKVIEKKCAKDCSKALLQPVKEKNTKENVIKGLVILGTPLPKGHSTSEKIFEYENKVLLTGSRNSTGHISRKSNMTEVAELSVSVNRQKPETTQIVNKGSSRIGSITTLEKKTDGIKSEKTFDKELQQPSERNLTNEREINVLNFSDLLLPKARTQTEKSLKASINEQSAPYSFQLREVTRNREKVSLRNIKGMGRSDQCPCDILVSDSNIYLIVKSSSKKHKSKNEGILLLLEGKPPKTKEKILKALALLGVELPEGQTNSDKKLIDQVCTDLGLPPAPNTTDMKKKHSIAAEKGFLQPLEGKSHEEKENILGGLAELGIPLPKGRTNSEKALIDKITKQTASHPIATTKVKNNNIKESAPLLEGRKGSISNRSFATPKLSSNPTQMSSSTFETNTGSSLQKLQKTESKGSATSFEGKTSEQKRNIVKELAIKGIMLPKGKTAADKQLIDQVRIDLGLPPEPPTTEMRNKYEIAAHKGLLRPLEGNTSLEKENIMKGLRDFGIPLPKGRSASEKELIKKIETQTSENVSLPLENIKIPDSISSKNIIESKSSAIQCECNLSKATSEKTVKKIDYKKTTRSGPECECKLTKQKSERSVIKKHLPLFNTDLRKKSERMQKAKSAGLLTPIQGKSIEQKQTILRGLAMLGLQLPEGKTESDTVLINNVRTNLGLPPQPQTVEMRKKYEKAADKGLLQPLEGKTATEKEKVMKGLHNFGIPLPMGRTVSEKALVKKIGALTSRNKSLALKNTNTPDNISSKNTAPLGSSSIICECNPTKQTSEKTINKKHLKRPEKPDSECECQVLKQRSEKSSIKNHLPLFHSESRKKAEKMQKAKTSGILTPIQGKSIEQKQKILKGLAMLGIQLPEGNTESDKILVSKVRADLGLPPEPQTAEMRKKYEIAADKDLLHPLEGKTTKQKEQTIKSLLNFGIPLPKGRTASEQVLIDKIQTQRTRSPFRITPAKPKVHNNAEVKKESVTESAFSIIRRKGSGKKRKTKTEELCIPLDYMTSEQKQKILKCIALNGLMLPEPKTESDKKIINQIRNELGLSSEPQTREMREMYKTAANKGFLQPLEGKSTKEKENILMGLHEFGIPLPNGRSESEKALINKILAQTTKHATLPTETIKTVDTTSSRTLKISASNATCECKLLHQKSEKSIIKHLPLFNSESRRKSEKMQRAKSAGLLTPIHGKSIEQKQKILRGLALFGIQLPEGNTESDKILITKVRTDLGLPPEPQTADMRKKYHKAADKGLLQPLEGRTVKQKEQIIKNLVDFNIPLPEGRSVSEKALIDKIQTQKIGRRSHSPQRKIKLRSKNSDIASTHLREPKKLSSKCECKLSKVKSEKKLIKKHLSLFNTESKKKIERMQKAKSDGLLTPIQGKTAEEKEKILKGLAMLGIQLPEGHTESDKKLINKVRSDIGLPPEPQTANMRAKYERAENKGLLQPLEGKTPKQKETILKGLINLGIPLPKGRFASEIELINKLKAKERAPALPIANKMKLFKKNRENKKDNQGQGLKLEKVNKATIAKIRTRHDEDMLKSITAAGLPVPKYSTTLENENLNTSVTSRNREPKQSNKIRIENSLTPVERETMTHEETLKHDVLPQTTKISSDSQSHSKVSSKIGKPPGLVASSTSKEKILEELADTDLILPEGQTSSEKIMVSKIKNILTQSDTSIVKPNQQILKQSAAIQRSLENKIPVEIEKKNTIDNVSSESRATPSSDKESISKHSHYTGVSSELEDSSLATLYDKTEAAILPLVGKSSSEKKKMLQHLHNAGIPLPSGKTPSEMLMIKEITKEKREMVTRDNNNNKKGLKSPDKSSGSDNSLVNITPVQKERISKEMLKAALSPPTTSEPSEKLLIAKTKQMPELSHKAETPSHYQEDSNKQTETVSLLESDLILQKKKILNELLSLGFSLPLSKTKSQKQILTNVRRATGLPPEPETPSIRTKYELAQAAGIIVPLEGKTDIQKQQILKRMHDAGVPLPEGRTLSEKNMIDRIQGRSIQPDIATAKYNQPKIKNAGAVTNHLDDNPIKLKIPVISKVQEHNKNRLKNKTESDSTLITAEIPPYNQSSNKVKSEKENSVTNHHLDDKTSKLQSPVVSKTAGHNKKTDKTLSKTQLSDKVKDDKELPSSPDTLTRYNKTDTGDIVLPPDDKTLAEKYKILQQLRDAGFRPIPGFCSCCNFNFSESDLTSLIKSYDRAQAAGLMLTTENKICLGKKNVLQHLHNSSTRLSEGINTAGGLTTNEKKRNIVQLAAVIDKQDQLSETSILKKKHTLPRTQPSSENKLYTKLRIDPEIISAIDKEYKAQAMATVLALANKTAKENIKILQLLCYAGKIYKITPSEEQIINDLKKLIVQANSINKRDHEVFENRAELPQPSEGITLPIKILKEKLYTESTALVPETSSEIQLLPKIKSHSDISLESKTLLTNRILVPLNDMTEISNQHCDAKLSLPKRTSLSAKLLSNKANNKLLQQNIVSLKSDECSQKRIDPLISSEDETTTRNKKFINEMINDGTPLVVVKTLSYSKLLAKIRQALESETRFPINNNEKAQTNETIILEDETPIENGKNLFKLHVARTAIDKKVQERYKNDSEVSDYELKTPEKIEKLLKIIKEARSPTLPMKITLSETQSLFKSSSETKLSVAIKIPSPIGRCAKARVADIILPREDKKISKENKLLHQMHNVETPLPKRGTNSEEIVINKIKKGLIHPYIVFSIRNDRGTEKQEVAPLDPGGKTAKKEKTLKDLLNFGFALPAAKTLSEKQLFAKIRRETGLSPEPEGVSIKDSHEQAYCNGLLTSSETTVPSETNKTLLSQELILKKIIKEAVLPEFNTVKTIQESSKISDNIFNAWKEKICKQNEEMSRLLLNTIPLIAKDGIDTRPTTELIDVSKNDRHEHAHAIDPFEGKSPPEELIIEVVKTRAPQSNITIKREHEETFEKLIGKINTYKEKKIKQKRTLSKAIQNISSPMLTTKTLSEKQSLVKSRREEESPSEPKTSSLVNTYEKAQASEFILSNEKNSENFQILQQTHVVRTSRPERRPPSEELMINKMKQEIFQSNVDISLSNNRASNKQIGSPYTTEDKVTPQKEKVLKELLKFGFALPVAKTSSERQLLARVRHETGLVSESHSASIKKCSERAQALSIIIPLNTSSFAKKNKLLQQTNDSEIQIPGSSSLSKYFTRKGIKNRSSQHDNVVIKKDQRHIEKLPGSPSAFHTKTVAEKKNVLKDLLEIGFSLPVAQTLSEKQLLTEVRKETGMPSEQEVFSLIKRRRQLQTSGNILPLESKENLKMQHEPHNELSVDKTCSDKLMIKNSIKKCFDTPITEPSPQEHIKQIGLFTPSERELLTRKEKILKNLLDFDFSVPSGKTLSELQLLEKVRPEHGLPLNSETPSLRNKNYQADTTGITVSVEGKSRKEKKNILNQLHGGGISLLESRAPSGNHFINEITQKLVQVGTSIGQSTSFDQSDYTFLEGETRSAKSNILKDSRALMKSVSTNGRRGKSVTNKINKASSQSHSNGSFAGLLGILTPIEIKAPEQKEDLLKRLIKVGLPLPISETPSQKDLLDKVRREMCLPPEPNTKCRYRKFSQPSIGRYCNQQTLAEKKDIKHKTCNAGLSRSDSRTQSEMLIFTEDKARSTLIHDQFKCQKAAEGMPSCLEDRIPSQKDFLNKIRHEMCLPPEPKICGSKCGAKKTSQPIDKCCKQKKNIIQNKCNVDLTLSDNRTQSEVSICEENKTRETLSHCPFKCQKTAEHPAMATCLEKKILYQNDLLEKIRREMCLLPEPNSNRSKFITRKISKASIGKCCKNDTRVEEKNIIQNTCDADLPLSESRTQFKESICIENKEGEDLSHCQIKLLNTLEDATYLKDKKPREENVVNKFRREKCLPPKAKLNSEKCRYKKVNEPSKELCCKQDILANKKSKVNQPNTGICYKHDTLSKNKNIVQKTCNADLFLSESRTHSEVSIFTEKNNRAALSDCPFIRQKSIECVAAPNRLNGRRDARKEQALKKLVKAGLPLPIGRTLSEKRVIEKIRRELGLPPLPNTPTLRNRYRRAQAAGIITPLEGKTPAQKKYILQKLCACGISLPEGRTPSEILMINTIKEQTSAIIKAPTSAILTPLECKTCGAKKKVIDKAYVGNKSQLKIRTPSEESMIKCISKKKLSQCSSQSRYLKAPKCNESETIIKCITPAQKESYLRVIVTKGLPLPEAKTAAEKKIIGKIRFETGLPPEPNTPSLWNIYKKAQAAGIIIPLEGKSLAEKKDILKNLHNAGIPLPKGRTCSEKCLIDEIIAQIPDLDIPNSNCRQIANAKQKKYSSPLEGMSSKAKEKIMRELVIRGLPLPETKTTADKKISNKVRKELGLPPEPHTPSMKLKYEEGFRKGILKPLEGLTPLQKEKLVRAQVCVGIPPPEGRTASEKSLIAHIKNEQSVLTKNLCRNKTLKCESLNDKKRINQGLTDVGIYIPLEGKSPKEIKNIQKNLAKAGYTLPERCCPSKSNSITVQEQKLLKDLLAAGIPIPSNLTLSEKALVKNLVNPTNSDSKHCRHSVSDEILNPLACKSRGQQRKCYTEVITPDISLPLNGTCSETDSPNKVSYETMLLPESRSSIEIIVKKVQPSIDKPSEKRMRLVEKCYNASASSSEEEILKKFLKKYPNLLKENCSRCRLSKRIKETMIGLAEQRLPLPNVEKVLYKAPETRVHKASALRGDRDKESMKETQINYNEDNLLKLLEKLRLEEENKTEYMLPSDADMDIPELGEVLKKTFVANIIDEARVSEVTSEEIHRAVADGYLLPLKKKQKHQKEKIIRVATKSKLPVPVGQILSQEYLRDDLETKYQLSPSVTLSLESVSTSEAEPKNLFDTLSGVILDQKEKLLKVLTEAGLPYLNDEFASDPSLLKQINDDFESLTELTALQEQLLSIDKSISLCPSDKVSEEKCSDQLFRNNNEQYKAKQRHVKIKSPDITFYCQCSKVHERKENQLASDVHSKIIEENDSIQVAVRSTSNNLSDTVFSTDSLLFVLNTDTMNYIDEIDCNSSINHKTLSPKYKSESKLCLTLTKYYESTDQMCTASLSAFVHSNPRITIHFSTQIDSNSSCDTYSTESVKSNNTVSLDSNKSSTNALRYLYHTNRKRSNNVLEKNESVIKEIDYVSADISSANIISISSSNNCSEVNMDVDEKKTVIVIYARCVQQTRRG